MTQTNWKEFCLIEIQRYDDTNKYMFGALTKSVDIPVGDKAIESTAVTTGGRIVKYTPEADTTITMEMFPVGAKANQSSPSGMLNWFFGDVAGGTHHDGGSYYFNKPIRYQYRVAVLWSSLLALEVGNASRPVYVSSALTNTGDHFRVSLWGAYMTKSPLAFTDNELTSTVEFVVPPYNNAGYQMIVAEESATVLPAMPNYGASQAYPTPSTWDTS